MCCKRPVLTLLAAASMGAMASFVPESYRNPVGWADIPDMGLCSDGKAVYMVSTTMHLVPGAPIMRSEDMVNWKVVSYAIARLPENEPRYNLGVNKDTGEADRTTAYGQGQWASSLRYHNGKFYLWFVMNGTGGFLYTADKAEGPWELYSKPGFMHDGSLFFDDDGSAYVAHGDGWITALTDDLKDRDTAKLDENKIDRSDETALLEGTSIFKHNGWYYRMMVSAYMPGIPRREVCYRSKSLRGPWEKKVILQTEFDNCGGIGQGCVVEHKGEWWALVFQDRGGVGRVPCLMPVVWTDDWPMLGNKDGSAIPNDGKCPYADVSGYIGSDEFDSKKLSLRWQWNHNPIDSAWSLEERPGWMRLKTSRVVDNLYLAPNTLTQRTCGPMCNGWIKLDTSNMKDGDVCGLAAFQGESATLNIIKAAGKKVLLMRSEKSIMEEPHHKVRSVDYNVKETVNLKDDIIYLRARLDYHHGENWAYMDYSLDGEKWRSIGDRVRMTFDTARMFMGTKFAIFNYATKKIGGWVDVDWFHFEALGHASPERLSPKEPSVVPFKLGATSLGKGPMKDRLDVDIDYLLNTVKVDRLLAEFRNVAGLGEKAPRYPNRWEGGQINGHSLGHYLSAVSALYAYAKGAGDKEVAEKAKAKVDYIIDELEECQNAHKNGFLMTCPQKIYDDVRAGHFSVGGFDINKWWVPNYTLHKIFAGLRDAYRWTGSKKALEIERKLGDWYIGVVQGLDDHNRQRLLVSEWGGLNETFANLADDTGDTKYRDAAEIYFDDRRIFDALKMRMDNLDHKHANTQVPKIAGLARLYEQTGKQEYRAAVETFWDSVVNKRSFANGGHSDDEHFHPIKEFPKKLGPHNNETCNINNMLRLTAHTFGWKPTSAQMDFVERALYNQLLAQIGKKPGEFGYFLSQAPVGEKVWSTPEGAWWCCVGTGMENPMHYADHVYYRSVDNETLYVNLFAPTRLDWSEKDVVIEQKTNFPYEQGSKLSIADAGLFGTSFTMKIRKPYWCRKMEVAVNGEKTGVLGKDGYIAITRKWKKGDEVAIKLPMLMHASILPKSEGGFAAFMYGPLVLVGVVPPEENKIDQAKMRWDDHLAAPGKTLERAMTVVTTNIVSEFKRFVKQDGGLRFKAEGLLKPADLEFMPLMDVYEEHYTTYFPVVKPRKWAKVEKKLEEQHKKEAEEEARKIDEVFPGFQQSEVNHDMRAEFSGTGMAYGKKWRNTIGCWGLIEYTLNVDGKGDNELVITVNGDDSDQRYDVLIDGEKLCREEHSRLKPGGLFDIVYKLPRSMTDGKEKIRVSIKGFDDIMVDGVKKPNTGSGWIGGFFYLCARHPAPEQTENGKGAKKLKIAIPPIHVEGRYIVDKKGNIFRYRGTMQSLSPFFSNGRWGGGDDDAAAKRCVEYMKEVLDLMGDRSQGSYWNMIRLTDDTHFCGKPGYRGNDRFERFDFDRHQWYIDNVLAPIVEYAVSKGIYPIVRPSMNTEQDTYVGDKLQEHFVKEWRQFAANKTFQRLSGQVAFELENEPVNVRNAENKDDPTAIADYMQPMIDAIREEGFKGIILVPGAGYQSWFDGYEKKMVTDPLNNFGFAAHIYPGWYGQSDETTSGESFLENVLKQIPVIRKYPVVVTECDWSPEKPGQGKFNEFGHWVPANIGSWGTASTSKWGKSLRWMAEELGNLSIMIGDANSCFDIDRYLRSAEVGKNPKYNLECCGPYAFKWYREWAKAKPMKPSEFENSKENKAWEK